MKVFPIVSLAVALALPTVIVFHGDAMAQTCQSDCALQGKACVQGARTTKAACRLDCRTNAAEGAIGRCVHDCAAAFRADRSGCQSDLPGCVTACEAPDDPSAPPTGGSLPCAGTCGQGLGTCAQSVVTQAKDCVRECPSASDRLGCFQGCAAAAHGGAEDCALDFTSCHEGCSGSPRGAFVD